MQKRLRNESRNQPVSRVVAIASYHRIPGSGRSRLDGQQGRKDRREAEGSKYVSRTETGVCVTRSQSKTVWKTQVDPVEAKRRLRCERSQLFLKTTHLPAQASGSGDRDWLDRHLNEDQIRDQLPQQRRLSRIRRDRLSSRSQDLFQQGRARSASARGGDARRNDPRAERDRSAAQSGNGAQAGCCCARRHRGERQDHAGAGRRGGSLARRRSIPRRSRRRPRDGSPTPRGLRQGRQRDTGARRDDAGPHHARFAPGSPSAASMR